MNRASALQQFWESFGIDAYVSTNVPDGAKFPYLTYEFKTSYFNAGEVVSTVDLWYYTESEAIPNAKAEEIARALGTNGKLVKCDEGYIWLKKGVPFSQPVYIQENNAIKRRYLNIIMEYLTN